MGVKKLSAKRQAKRRYQTDRPINVYVFSTVAAGTLPEGSLIRDEQRTDPRTLAGYRTTFEASTDRGKTWDKCATNDDYISFKS